ncbi:hypothetical protein PTMSG1_00778 [Pyrenophora teres f. maculata]|nr:hypothetical protein PTMSG1_00778 [Pyrenophora teres f. maculata]
MSGTGNNSTSANLRGGCIKNQWKPTEWVPAVAAPAPLQNGDTAGPSLPVPAGANAAIWNTLCTVALKGSFMVDITAEREAPRADPNHPLFRKGVTSHPSQSTQWQNTILPYIRQLIFKVSSTADVFYMGRILQCPLLPGLHENVMKPDMAAVHWFSGVAHNHRSNPFLNLASTISPLMEVAFTLHAASITISMWGERLMIELEATDACARQGEEGTVSTRYMHEVQS